ncbi:hypothetical protein BDQ17DRAFT_1428255 [Cyathus striatus]|nr:hypothetical protein BDQ17DRAFT_1428255 [Cyathus striatus]
MSVDVDMRDAHSASRGVYVMPLDSLENTVDASECGPWFARHLCKWLSSFITDSNNLPENIYGMWNTSRLHNENMKNELNKHIMSLGKFFSAMDLKNYLDFPEVQE